MSRHRTAAIQGQISRPVGWINPTAPRNVPRPPLPIPQIRPFVARGQMQRLKPAPLRLALRAAQPVAQILKGRSPARNLREHVRVCRTHVAAREALGTK